MRAKLVKEELYPGIFVHYQFERVLCKEKSPFQDILIAEVKGFGKTLFLNEILQSAQVDEKIYHETLVHPAFFFHPSPQDILILGGGEGATLREVLKHPVKHVTMVDIDRDVVELSQKHLPEWSQNAFYDPRVELVFQDAFEFVKNTQKKYDIIISDLTDPFMDPLSTESFSKTFYSMAKKVLKEGGIIVVQSGSMDFHYYPHFQIVEENLKENFNFVISYARHIYSFFSIWGFHLASDTDYFAMDKVKRDLQFLDKLHYINPDAFFVMVEKAKFYKKEVERYGEADIR